MALPARASALGPTLGSACPAIAADTPRQKMVMLNAAAVSLKVQPESRTSMVWKKLQAYTVPRHSWSTVQKRTMTLLGARTMRSAYLERLTAARHFGGGGPWPAA